MATDPLPVWPVVRIVVLKIPPYRLFLFPFMAASVWFLTLSILMLTWLARGTPRYPGQGNPYIAFISDIASFELKPLFLVGASLTAIFFIVTIAAVHVVRYEYYPPIYPSSDISSSSLDNGNDDPPINHQSHERRDSEALAAINITKTRTLISLVSIVAAFVAATGLILLGIMDTIRYHKAHDVLLKICLAGLALEAAGTVVVYAEEVVSFLTRWKGDNEEDRRMRRWLRFCTLASAVMVIIEFCLGIAFLILTAQSCWRAAGVIEWIMAFLGTGYMGLFAGFFIGIKEEARKYRIRPSRVRRENRDYNVEDINERERRPLLAEERLDWAEFSS